MNFSISKIQSVQEIQESFFHLYPFLKIEFLKRVPENKQPGYQSAIYALDIKIKDIDNHFCEGAIEIDEAMTVGQLESGFFNRFGLYLHLSRKIGNIWLAITKTNHLTLKQQNDQGKEILQA